MLRRISSGSQVVRGKLLDITKCGSPFSSWMASAVAQPGVQFQGAAVIGGVGATANAVNPDHAFASNRSPALLDADSLRPPMRLRYGDRNAMLLVLASHDQVAKRGVDELVQAAHAAADRLQLAVHSLAIRRPLVRAFGQAPNGQVGGFIRQAGAPLAGSGTGALACFSASLPTFRSTYGNSPVSR